MAPSASVATSPAGRSGIVSVVASGRASPPGRSTRSTTVSRSMTLSAGSLSPSGVRAPASPDGRPSTASGGPPSASCIGMIRGIRTSDSTAESSTGARSIGGTVGGIGVSGPSAVLSTSAISMPASFGRRMRPSSTFGMSSATSPGRSAASAPSGTSASSEMSILPGCPGVTVVAAASGLWAASILTSSASTSGRGGCGMIGDCSRRPTSSIPPEARR